MGRIYHGAETVIAWLGPSDKKTPVVFYAIETLSSFSCKHDELRGVHDPFTYRRDSSLSINNRKLHPLPGNTSISYHEWSAYIELLERS